jgi:hypothetical protein
LKLLAAFEKCPKFQKIKSVPKNISLLHEESAFGFKNLKAEKRSRPIFLYQVVQVKDILMQLAGQNAS